MEPRAQSDTQSSNRRETDYLPGIRTCPGAPCRFTRKSDEFKGLTNLVTGLLSTYVAKEFVSKGATVSKNMDLNRATEQELTVVQGIGKDNAKKIVQHRLQNGSFKTWEDLKQIPGLPPHLSDALKRCGFTLGGQAA